MGAPAFAVFADPVEQRPLKTDVVTQSLGFQPLVAQDLLPLCKEFLIKRGLFDEFARGYGLCGQGEDMETTVVRRGTRCGRVSAPGSSQAGHRFVIPPIESPDARRMRNAEVPCLSFVSAMMLD